jgi:hypothetical protein
VNRYLTLAFMTFLLVCIRSVHVMRVCDSIHLLQVSLCASLQVLTISDAFLSAPAYSPCKVGRVSQRPARLTRDLLGWQIVIFFSSNFLFITRCSALFSSKSRLVFWILLSLAAVQAIVQLVCSLKNKRKLEILSYVEGEAESQASVDSPPTAARYYRMLFKSKSRESSIRVRVLGPASHHSEHVCSSSSLVQCIIS